MAIIKIDSSDVLVVLVCQTCAGVWRACAWSRDEAYAQAIAHELRAHPGSFEARDAHKKWLARGRVGRPPLVATRR